MAELKKQVLDIISKCEIQDITVIVEDYPYPNFRAAVYPNERLMIVSPNMAKESHQFLVNVITHELGHILAGHGANNRPTNADEVIPFEAEANDFAVLLYVKFYPIETFYYNHKDEARMENHKKQYKVA